MQQLLPADIAMSLRKLLRQNLDRLRFVGSTDLRIDFEILNNLDVLLYSLYPDPEVRLQKLPELEQLVTAYQTASGQRSIRRKALEDLEQQIFEFMGFQQKLRCLQNVILVVDDNPENLRLLSSALSRQGYDVRSAISGSMALAGIDNINPDLILLDIMMPGVDGYAVCESLKTNEISRDIPVIFISAIDDVLDKVKAFRAGGVDYITKPFHIEEVVARVEHQINIRNLQKRLEEQNERLQQEIIARKQAEKEVLTLLEQEKEFSELKSRFISIASHEFRTPLTTIQSSAELLAYVPPEAEEKNQLIQQIRAAVQHMNQLLEDALVMDRPNADHQQLLKPSWFDLSQFCLEIVTEIQRNAGTRYQLSLTQMLTNPMVWLDQKTLRQIMYNLLSNAVKYSPQGGQVEVLVTQAGDPNQHYLTLQVKDQGIGIPPKDRERLFEAFHRATNVSTIPGTGLGLAIVKKCLDALDGKITVDSAVDIGTTFTVTLPLLKPPTEDAS